MNSSPPCACLDLFSIPHENTESGSVESLSFRISLAVAGPTCLSMQEHSWWIIALGSIWNHLTNYSLQLECGFPLQLHLKKKKGNFHNHIILRWYVLWLVKVTRSMLCALEHTHSVYVSVLGCLMMVTPFIGHLPINVYKCCLCTKVSQAYVCVRAN